MRRWLPELCALLMLPWLLSQARRTRSKTPRLPEARGARGGICLPDDALMKEPALHLMVIGESPVAGVGVDEQAQAITAQYALRLAALKHQPVQWRAFGENDATAADALGNIVLQLRQLSGYQPDIVLIAFGVNDTTAFHSSTHYHRDLSLLIDTLRAVLNPGLFVITGVPPLHLFPALPQLLRHVLGMKAWVLSKVAHQLTASLPHTIYVPFDSKTYTPGSMAEDGYHPSAAGVLVWAGQLAEATAAALVTPA